MHGAIGAAAVHPVGEESILGKDLATVQLSAPLVVLDLRWSSNPATLKLVRLVSIILNLIKLLIGP